MRHDFSRMDAQESTLSANSRRGMAPPLRSKAIRLPASGDVSDWSPEAILMTLTTPCEVPTHSRWHTLSGIFVLLTSYAGAIGFLKWFLS